MHKDYTNSTSNAFGAVSKNIATPDPSIDKFATQDDFEKYIEVKPFNNKRFTQAEYSALPAFQKAKLRDNCSAYDKQENPEKIYRCITQQQLDDIIKNGTLITPREAGVRGKNSRTNDEGVSEGRNTLQFYLGHASRRYGSIIIEAPNRPFKDCETNIIIKNELGLYQKQTLEYLKQPSFRAPDILENIVKENTL